MAENKKKDETLLKNLAHLRRRALDVKFDLDLTSYQPIENIGIGAYGVVCSAIHQRTNDRVAIKKIPNVFDVKDVAKRTYREIKILKHFKHDNVINILEILKPKETLSDFRDVYVVFDLMESDLHKIIYSKQELTDEHVCYFLYQILRGLKYVHSADVIHRDLKPSNLLVNEDCQLRIGDFGMARGFCSSPADSKVFMTQYVATRWYRAPEIMLSLIEYGAAVDMWSVGCIFAEMLGRKHLFPGKDMISQIKLIVGVTGTPDNSLLELFHSPTIKAFFQKMGHKDPIPWSVMYPKASKKAINFLSRMLVLNPKNRITVEQALVHPYLNKYHDPDDEPICIPTFNFDFEEEDLKIADLRETIYKEIMEFHEPRTPTFSFNAFLRPVPKSPDIQFDDSVNQSDIKLSQPILTSVPGQGTPDKSVTEITCDVKVETDKPQNIIIKPDDDIFKKPLSAKNLENSAYIKTENLLKVESSDIEMLSAKSTDGRRPMSATVSEEVTVRKVMKEPVTKENKEPQLKDEKNKTISEDTKTLIKAALMNASFKKRTDSLCDEDRPKPITAAMRQREREDKRKKKKEKTMERKKKEKKKKSQGAELLTSEDKEMLQRWAKMQQINVPIAPKPRTEVGGQGQTVSSTAGLMPASTRNNVNKSNTVSSRTAVQVRKGSSDEAIHGHSNGRVQQGTLDLLQQRILRKDSASNIADQSTGSTSLSMGSNSASTSADQTMANHCLSQAQMSCETINRPIVCSSQPIHESQSGLMHSNDNFSVDFSRVPIGDLSNVPLGDIDFLAMMPSPEIANILAQNIPDELQSNTLSASRQNFNNLQNTEMYSADQFNQSAFSSEASTSEFIEHLCSGASTVNNRRTSGHFVPLDVPRNNSPNTLSVSPNFHNRVSPTAQYLPAHSPGSHHSISPNQRVSPNLSFEPVTSQNIQQTSGFSQPIIPQHPVSNMPSYQTNDLSLCEMNPANLFIQSTQTHNQTVTQSNQSCMYGNQSGLQEVGNQHATQSNQNYVYRTQSGLPEVRDSYTSSSNSNSPPALSVNTQHAQMTFRQIFQEPVAGPSHAGNPLNETQVDLVALLTKQLSKSNVVDLCPPLALTPRGTGAGYGVGVDLDALMVASENDSQPPEPSPLSSSILADWMEVTGNMNIDMEALEQELQSPMALSYNDINMYSS